MASGAIEYALAIKPYILVFQRYLKNQAVFFACFANIRYYFFSLSKLLPSKSQNGFLVYNHIIVQQIVMY